MIAYDLECKIDKILNFIDIRLGEPKGYTTVIAASGSHWSLSYGSCNSFGDNELVVIYTNEILRVRVVCNSTEIVEKMKSFDDHKRATVFLKNVLFRIMIENDKLVEYLNHLAAISYDEGRRDGTEEQQLALRKLVGL